MKQLLTPVYKGSVKYLRVTSKELLNYCYLNGLPTDGVSMGRYQNQESGVYLVSEIMEWLLNKAIADGYALIGSDEDAWILAKNEDL